MTAIFDGIANAGLLDEVFISGIARNSGTYVADLTGYFKEWDKEYGIIHLYLERDSSSRRVIAISAAAVTWIKSALTGEFVYQKDPRAMIFGRGV